MASTLTQEQYYALLLAQQQQMAAQEQARYVSYGAAPQTQYHVAPQTQYQVAPQQHYVAPMQQPSFAAPQPQTQQTFTLPGDAFPGKTYEFQAADGRMISFQVPQGMGPGSQVQVTY